MSSLPLIAAFTAMVASALGTPIMRWAAPKLGAVDAPGGRRVHTRITPRMGGVAVIEGVLVALGITFLVDGAWLPAWKQPSVLGFLAGGLVIGIVGAIDDVKEIGAKRKLAGQIAAATIAAVSGARFVAVEVPIFGALDIGPVMGIVLGVIWIVAFINALNLIDGLDGLASGVAFFAALTNSVIAYMTGNDLALVLNAALGGAVLGFLFYNFNPATIFLGDTGSMFLGYALGGAALLTGRQKESTLISLLVPLLALGVPMADTIFTMIRRFLARRPLFSADRGHIHHRLLDHGLTHRRAVLFLYACSVVLCVLALGAAFGKDWQVGVALSAAVLTLVGMGRFAGYFEVTRLRRIEQEHAHAPATETLRRMLPGIVLAARQATTRDEVTLALAQVLACREVAAIRLRRTPNSDAIWATNPPTDTTNRPRGETRTLVLGGETASDPGTWTVEFDYVTVETAVPAHVEVLLRVASDVVVQALVRVAAGA
jgi:UDP-GlcNAc:undecaprenyl-phosphate GlcNAc-1-phosphate transferase